MIEVWSDAGNCDVKSWGLAIISSLEGCLFRPEKFYPAHSTNIKGKMGEESFGRTSSCLEAQSSTQVFFFLFPVRNPHTQNPIILDIWLVMLVGFSLIIKKK